MDARPSEIEQKFDETWYLQRYQDVARTVGSGRFNSALEHYLLHGRDEGRLPFGPAAEQEGEPPTPLPVVGEPDLEAIRTEALSHRGAQFLAPTTLRVTRPKPLKIVMIGSCMLTDWNLKPVASEISHLDLFVVNFLAGLPEKTRSQIEEYDFAVLQIPLRSISGDPTFWGLRYDDVDGHRRAFENACDRLEQQLVNWLAWNREHGLLTFVCNFFVPQGNPMGRLLPRYDLRNPQYVIERLNEHLEHLVRREHNAYIFDLDRVCASLGRRYIQDDVVQSLGHHSFLGYNGPITDRIEPVAALTEYYERNWIEALRPALWAELHAMYRTIRQIDPVKLVVVDLDDTLWKGVSGDMAEIDPAAMTEGWPLGVVEALMYLRKRGILLAILSKNEDQRVREIFPQIWGNKLRLEDFAAVTVNWRPKSQNMAEMLATMNLLPRNVVFIDDNPAERAAMQAAFPDMRILGRHLYYIRRILLWSAETDVVSVTEESSRRTEMVQRQFEREGQRKVLSREDFLASAAPRVEIMEIPTIAHPRFARVQELINKTNQFNTTGQRWKAEELSAFFGAGGRIFAFSVTDSFTSYGLVGVVLTQGSRIVQWVMSCRVLGYEIEQAIMAHLLPVLQTANAEAVRGRLIETDVNYPCRSLFSSCGFIQDGDDWRLPEGAKLAAPSHVAMQGL